MLYAIYLYIYFVHAMYMCMYSSVFLSNYDSFVFLVSLKLFVMEDSFVYEKEPAV